MPRLSPTVLLNLAGPRVPRGRGAARHGAGVVDGRRRPPGAAEGDAAVPGHRPTGPAQVRIHLQGTALSGGAVIYGSSPHLHTTAFVVRFSRHGGLCLAACGSASAPSMPARGTRHCADAHPHAHFPADSINGIMSLPTVSFEQVSCASQDGIRRRPGRAGVVAGGRGAGGAALAGGGPRWIQGLRAAEAAAGGTRRRRCNSSVTGERPKPTPETRSVSKLLALTGCQ